MYQRSQFAVAATQYKAEYESKANQLSEKMQRVATAEIEQSKVRAKINFNGVLTDGSERLRQENAEIGRLKISVQELDIGAEQIVADQRSTLVAEAAQALSKTPQAVVSEANLAINQHELELRNSEAHAQKLEFEANSSFQHLEQ